ncbi:MAG: SAM-dependent DNA methyltransferase [Planctomycetes bacterium]|nr:SAM-dependent DNA methyltransferase [Planctomycetota bacterium]
MRQHEEIEQRRVELQAGLDSAKSQAQRNKLGQFATPMALAEDILRAAKSLLPKGCPVRFLDPAFGTGAFYSALLRCFPQDRIDWAKGYEIDPHYGQPARKLWEGTPLALTLGDFTTAVPPSDERGKATLVVCNPPYVRHHHLDAASKQRLRAAYVRASGVDLNGLTGLYCHFVTLSNAWMGKDALAIWLIPSEFMDVNYGGPLKEYLLNCVTLMRIHRFDPDHVQFDDALVSSAVVCFRNAAPPDGHLVEFTYGGTIVRPEQRRLVARSELRPEAKWTRLAFANKEGVGEGWQPKLSDLFAIKRGIATGANAFFVLPEAKAEELGLPHRFLKPILPSPRFVRTDEIEADEKGNPLIDPRMVLLDCRLPEDEIHQKYPRLWEYLQGGRAQCIHERYLCQHREPWYSQEYREPAPILCTYMGRTGEDKGAFRFILNHSRAITANVYLLLYPKVTLARMLHDKPELLRAVWTALNEIPWDALLDVGRVYGGGLHKMEPKELAEAPADTLLAVLPEEVSPSGKQLTLTW